MSSRSSLTAAFYVRNEFQILHFKRLHSSFENAIWISGSSGLRRILKKLGYKHIHSTRQLKTKNIKILFHQGGVEAFMLDLDCKLAMVQYSYAKAPYNFGLWRGAADIIFAYGDYATTRFSSLAHAVAVGNPRWDEFRDPLFRERAHNRHLNRLSNGLPNIVYAPTWGEISSIEEWMQAVVDLGSRYNIFIKGHHNTTLRNTSTKSNGVFFVPEEDLFELLVIADVLISDYSGAIFDGLLCEKPVVLLDISNVQDKSGNKLDYYSPELAERDILGVRVSNPLNLADVINKVLADPVQVLEKSSHLRECFFECDPNVCQRIVRISEEICNEGYHQPPSQMQIYIKQGVIKLNKKILQYKHALGMCLVLLFLCFFWIAIAF